MLTTLKKSREQATYGVFFICNKLDRIEKDTNPESVKLAIAKEIGTYYGSIEPNQLHFVNSKQALDSYSKDYVPMSSEFSVAEQELVKYIEKIIQKRVKNCVENHLAKLTSASLQYTNTLKHSGDAEDNDLNKKAIYDMHEKELKQNKQELLNYEKECEAHLSELERCYKTHIQMFWKKHKDEITYQNYTEKITTFIGTIETLANMRMNTLQVIQENEKLKNIDSTLQVVASSISKPNVVNASIGVGATVAVCAGAAGIVGAAFGVGVVGAVGTGGLMLLLGVPVLIAIVAINKKKEQEWKELESSDNSIGKLVQKQMDPLSREFHQQRDSRNEAIELAKTLLSAWLRNCRSKQEIEEQFGELELRLSSIEQAAFNSIALLTTQ